MTRETDAARAGTRVDGTHRPENRGERAAVTNQGYLIQGLQQRRAEVQAHLDLLARISPGPRSRVAAGALFEIEDEHQRRAWYLVLPGGQGLELGDVTVLSPESPIARALHGLAEGDTATVTYGTREVEVEVLSVR